MNLHPVRRRTLIQGSAWLVPTVTVGALAPHAAATPVPTCPSPAPVVAQGRLDVPDDFCAGGQFSGDFTFSITSPSVAYSFEVLRLEVSSRVLVSPFPWNPYEPIFATWTPSGVQPLDPTAPINGAGNIPNIPPPRINRFQIVYVLSGAGLPPGGCEYSVGLGWSVACG
ncbi:MAG: hypothetical protein KBB39_09755 [Phycicoccus sp.]|nr:hypothetical protein [Phycicoccus sp.]